MVGCWLCLLSQRGTAFGAADPPHLKLKPAIPKFPFQIPTKLRSEKIQFGDQKGTTMVFTSKKNPLALLLFVTHLLLCTSTQVLEPYSSWTRNEVEVRVKRDCAGNLRGGCLWEEEMEMDSEISRRILAAQKKYISYEALKRDEVPCSKPGASYYNCQAPPKTNNPYSRGCTVITGCARDTHY